MGKLISGEYKLDIDWENNNEKKTIKQKLAMPNIVYNKYQNSRLSPN